MTGGYAPRPLLALVLVTLGLDTRPAAPQTTLAEADSIRRSVVALSRTGNTLDVKRAIELQRGVLRFTEDRGMIRSYAAQTNNLGALYMKLGRPDTALVYFERSITLDLIMPEPRDWHLGMSYFWKGRALLQLSRPEEALEFLRLASELLDRSAARGDPIRERVKRTIEIAEAVPIM